uniref:TSA: Wollemia nobilis Ref_Wollemi_Transcript_4534_2863 transcribed RNA sequence n=1 Tax=Wollemia nobilis TaxID=56998 RepID=A0A0C9QW61_9CONI
MAPSKLRKAIGVVKDQTSISIAKVASNNAPDLDVAIVKATSHDEIPIDEKYVYAILHLTSYSRGYVSACVHSLSKRISKTHNWVVALKALMLIHRLLLDGDPNFEQEVLQAMRHGARLLNLSDFRDDSHSNAWDYSAFVRTYGLYLDERLDCSILGKIQFGDKSSKGPKPRGGDTETSWRGGYEYSDGRRSGYEYNDGRRSPGRIGYRSGHNEYESSYGGSPYRSRNGDYDGTRKQQEPEETEKNRPVAVRDMKPEMILDRMPYWQRLLERFLASRPTGAAKNNRLVQVALYLVVKESFQLYKDINDGLAILLDGFFDMEYQDSVSAFELYSKAAKQIDELASFYNLCKNIGVCRTSEYPDVQKVQEKLLETLEEFLRDRSSKNRPKSPEPRPKRPESPGPISEEPVEDMNTIKALPAPGDDMKKEIEEPKLPPILPKQEEKEVDLLNLNQATISSEEQENQFALALFTGGTPGASNSAKNWETFSTSEGPASNGTTSAWQTPLAENGREGWELALVESASNLSKQQNKMPGSFNPLVLEGLYEQAAANQQYNPYAQPGSASSVAAMPRPNAPQYLALPAPPTHGGAPVSVPAGGDPFAASLAVPAPSYVQMAEMAKKQQLLVHEQQLWQQYQNNGMQYQVNGMQYPNIGMQYPNNGMQYPNNGMPYRFG